MKNAFVDKKVLALVDNLLVNLFYTDKMSNQKDAKNEEIYDHNYVTEKLVERNGHWEIYLVFSSMRKPFLFHTRKVAVYASKKKAQLSAEYFRRRAHRNINGPINLGNKDYKVCSN